jgi:hypothetical protein
MPWVKGQSGNPGGRPKRKWSWSQVLEEVGEQVEPSSGKKFARLVAERVWREALKGDHNAYRELFNRMDGYPMQPTDLTTDGKKIQGLVIYRPKREDEGKRGKK